MPTTGDDHSRHRQHHVGVTIIMVPMTMPTMMITDIGMMFSVAALVVLPPALTSLFEPARDHLDHKMGLPHPRTFRL